MKGITALGNEEINKALKKELEISGRDIQYQEAVLEILENNETIEFLVLSSIIPGQFNIYEFINLIIFKNPKIKIIIILEKREKELEDFLISKGINNIYYNNEITIQEIINNIKNNNKNKNTNYEIKKIKKTEKIKKIIYNKFIKINKKENKIKNKKIITIIGPPQIGKTIFSIIFCLINKNKKILLINLEKNKNNSKIILKKYIKNKNNKDCCVAEMTKNTDVVFFNDEEKFAYIKKILNNWQIKNDENFTEYDYIVFDTDGYGNSDEFLKISDEIILITEANLLGINSAKEILQFLINNLKTQKDNIKIVFNKHNIMSINLCILKKCLKILKF